MHKTDDAELKEILPQLGFRDLKLFDDTLVNDFVTNGETTIKYASKLFIGAVDEATTIAESYGGGGTSDDED